MSKGRTCWAVERWVDVSGGVTVTYVAVCKSKKRALRWITERGNPHDSVTEVERAHAVESVRWQVYERDEGRCVRCGDPLTFNMMHLHEREHRGKGGEISVENSECRCSGCHIGPTGAHGDRRPQFSKKGLGRGVRG